MKTLQEIKDEVAQKEGHADWLTLCFRENLTSINLLWEQVAKRHGEMLLREAAERARTRTNDESTSIIVDKKSILSIIDEMK